MTVSLILNEHAIARSRVGELPNLPPAVAIVYPVEGGPFQVERVRTFSERWLGKGRPCFAVDLSDHRRQASVTKTPLTCRDGGHRFQATIDVGFRVHDPAVVVARNVRDALTVVYGYLTDRIRLCASRFAITEAMPAQLAVNQELDREIRLPEGITIYHCKVQMEPDEAAARYIQGLEEARRRAQLGRHTHEARLGEARSDEEIEDIRAEARRRREEQERAAMAGRPLDFERLVQEHLVRHPEQTAHALELLARVREAEAAQHEIRDQRHAEMVKYLIERGVVREVDLPGLRQGVLGPSAGGTGVAGVLQRPDAAVAPSFVSGSPPQISAGTAPAAVQTGTGPVQWGGSTPVTAAAPPSGLVPVYLVLDTSPSAADCLTDLGNLLRSVQTLLANSPDVAAAIRLSVITYADGADVLMPLTEVSWRTGVPGLDTTPGCRYRPVMRRLKDLVPLETERLKEQVPRVLRPVVFFLAVGQAEDDGEWPAAHAELMAHTYHPHLVACGIGPGRVRTVQRLASRPELGVVAAEGADLGQSAVQFSVLVQETLLHLGRSALAGQMELRLACPQGLTPMTDGQ
ncbi:vWA domain-containing protein [Streptomyces pseudogriseolus]|uniref:vWA domain-containing protein n=1 Tax=Streptomyces pseudogriseolus TaxID=36817 RepID=UPI003FA1C3AB